MALNYLSEKYFLMANPEAIKKGEDKINCKCHICGDSKKNSKKQRLWLYTKEGFKCDVVHCFNCNYSSSLSKYLKVYHPNLYELYRRDIKSNYSKKPIKVMKDIPKATMNIFNKYKGIFRCDKNTPKEVIEYLNFRGITDISKFYYASGEVTTPTKIIQLKGYYIIYPLNSDWNGFWGRSINEKKFHNYVFNGDKMIKNITTNSKTIYIFEALFDALSSGAENFYALNGSYMKIDKRDYKEKFIYVYDNDKTGLEQSLRILKENHYLSYPWDLYPDVKDINELKLKYKLSNTEIFNIINSNIVSDLEGFLFIQEKLKHRGIF